MGNYLTGGSKYYDIIKELKFVETKLDKKVVDKDDIAVLQEKLNNISEEVRIQGNHNDKEIKCIKNRIDKCRKTLKSWEESIKTKKINNNPQRRPPTRPNSAKEANQPRKEPSKGYKTDSDTRFKNVQPHLKKNDTPTEIHSYKSIQKTDRPSRNESHRVYPNLKNHFPEVQPPNNTNMVAATAQTSTVQDNYYNISDTVGDNSHQVQMLVDVNIKNNDNPPKNKARDTYPDLERLFDNPPNNQSKQTAERIPTTQMSSLAKPEDHFNNTSPSNREIMKKTQEKSFLNMDAKEKKEPPKDTFEQMINSTSTTHSLFITENVSPSAGTEDELSIKDVQTSASNDASDEMEIHEEKRPLDMINQKLFNLQDEIEKAEEARDLDQLERQKIEVNHILDDLKKVKVAGNLGDIERKEYFIRSISRSYKKILDVKTKLERELRLENLTEDQKRDQYQQSLKNLETVHQEIHNIRKHLTLDNLVESRQALKVHKRKLEEIEDLNQAMQLKKSKVFDAVISAENQFTQMEMKQRLIKTEEEFSKIVNNDDSDVIEPLLQLKKDVEKVLEVNQNVNQKKKDLLEQIDSLLNSNTSSQNELHEVQARVEDVSHHLNNKATEETLLNLRQSLKEAKEMLDNNKDKGEVSLLEKIHHYSGEIENKLQAFKKGTKETGDTLDDVAKELELLKSKIKTFNGDEKSEAYFQLDDGLMRNTLRLDGLKFEKGSEMHTRKVQLLRKINQYNRILDERVSQ